MATHSHSCSDQAWGSPWDPPFPYIHCIGSPWAEPSGYTQDQLPATRPLSATSLVQTTILCSLDFHAGAPGLPASTMTPTHTLQPIWQRGPLKYGRPYLLPTQHLPGPPGPRIKANLSLWPTLAVPSLMSPPVPPSLIPSSLTGPLAVPRPCLQFQPPGLYLFIIAFVLGVTEELTFIESVLCPGLCWVLKYKISFILQTKLRGSCCRYFHIRGEKPYELWALRWRTELGFGPRSPLSRDCVWAQIPQRMRCRSSALCSEGRQGTSNSVFNFLKAKIIH